jgi:hypothetical protein
MNGKANKVFPLEQIRPFATNLKSNQAETRKKRPKPLFQSAPPDYLPVLLDEPAVVPAEPVAPVPPVAPEVPLVEPVPPEDAAVELDFLAFAFFLDFFFLGVSVPDAASPLAPEVEAPADEPLPGVEAEVPVPPAMPPSLPVPAPVAPVLFWAAGLELEPEVAAAGELPELEPVAPVLPEPEDELPLVPDAPELEPEAPELDAPAEEPLPGVEAEVPVPPAMPPSLPVPAPVEPVLAWLPGLAAALAGSDVDEAPELCASAIEDTEAISTNDSERKVDFNVMSYSLFFNGEIASSMRSPRGSANAALQQGTRIR